MKHFRILIFMYQIPLFPTSWTTFNDILTTKPPLLVLPASSNDNPLPVNAHAHSHERQAPKRKYSSTENYQ